MNSLLRTVFFSFIIAFLTRETFARRRPAPHGKSSHHYEEPTFPTPTSSYYTTKTTLSYNPNTESIIYPTTYPATHYYTAATLTESTPYTDSTFSFPVTSYSTPFLTQPTYYTEAPPRKSNTRRIKTPHRHKEPNFSSAAATYYTPTSTEQTPNTESLSLTPTSGPGTYYYTVPGSTVSSPWYTESFYSLPIASYPSSITTQPTSYTQSTVYSNPYSTPFSSTTTSSPKTYYYTAPEATVSTPYTDSTFSFPETSYSTPIFGEPTSDTETYVQKRPSRRNKFPRRYIEPTFSFPATSYYTPPSTDNENTIYSTTYSTPLTSDRTTYYTTSTSPVSTPYSESFFSLPVTSYSTPITKQPSSYTQSTVYSTEYSTPLTSTLTSGRTRHYYTASTSPVSTTYSESVTTQPTPYTQSTVYSTTYSLPFTSPSTSTYTTYYYSAPENTVSTPYTESFYSNPVTPYSTSTTAQSTSYTQSAAYSNTYSTPFTSTSTSTDKIHYYTTPTPTESTPYTESTLTFPTPSYFTPINTQTTSYAGLIVSPTTTPYSKSFIPSFPGATFCMEIYKPVCAYNGDCYKNFLNECEVNISNEKLHISSRKYHVVSQGKCEDQAHFHSRLCNCNTVCPYLYDPICAFDGNSYTTFPNTCVLNNYHCKNRHQPYVTMYRGKCDGRFANKTWNN